MTHEQAIKKIMQFINRAEGFDFEERLILLRAMKEVKYNVDRGKDNLDTILLKLRYGVKQDIPKEWRTTYCIPSEIEMAGDLVSKPVPKGYIVRGGEYKRPARTEKALKKLETETAKPVGRKLAIV
jgi:hypothetical protein